MRQQATFVLSLPSYSLVSVFPKLLFSVYSRHAALYTPIIISACAIYMYTQLRVIHTRMVFPHALYIAKTPRVPHCSACYFTCRYSLRLYRYCIPNKLLYTTSSAKPMNVLRESDEQSETVSDCSSDSFKQVIVRGLHMIKVMFAETTTKLCFYIIHIFALV